MKKEKKIERKAKLIYISFAIIFIVICYFIFQVISTALKPEEYLDIDNISKYIIKESYVDENGKKVESNVVRDYNTFYTVQNASENFIENMLNENYEASYEILSKEMKNKYSKDEYLVKIKEFSESRLKSSVMNVESVDNTGVATDFTLPLFDNNNNMKYVYKISDTEYIGESMDRSFKIFKIGIRMQNGKYEIFYIEF